PTGIELAKFERPEIKQENLKERRSKLGIQDGEKTLLSLSRISYEKNIQAVLVAFADVLKEEDKVKLVVAGDGPYL
ncbi:glycosyltransferase, partial [Vibrio cholerae O1]|nr:glycosyltransferase [Vibrio cholerae O1]